MAVFRQNDLQFPDPETGHVLPDHLHFIDNGCVIDLLGISGLPLLPKSLTGKAEQPAESLQGYFRVSPFEFVDCPASAFFDRSIPYSSLRICIIIS